MNLRTCVALAVLLTGCHGGSPQPESSSSALPSVTVTTVHHGTLEQVVHVTGTLVPPRDRQATVSPPVAGVLARLDVHLGQQVVRHEVIGQLSSVAVEGQIHQARAALAQNKVQVHQAEANAAQQAAQTQSAIYQAQSALTTAQANLIGARATLQADRTALDTAQRNYARLHHLEGDGLVATKDVEAARLAVSQAEATWKTQGQTVKADEETVESQRQALRAAQAGRLTDQVKREDVNIARDQVRNAQGALMTAEGQASLYTLRSPIDGQVTAVGASTGETVDTTAKVVTLADLSVLDMQLAVPAKDRERVHAGQEVDARIDGITVRGRVSLVQSQVDAQSDTVTALSRISNPGQRLANGAYLTGDIVVARASHVLVVPQTAIVNPSSLVVVDDKDVAHLTPVKLGLQTDHAAEVVSGVGEGSRVVVSGGYGLPDGTQVQVTK